MLGMTANSQQRIKWGYATQVLAQPPLTWGELNLRLEAPDDPPRANDVIVAEVLTIGRHKRIELWSGRRAVLFPGDLVGVAYGNRYATRQWRGVVPEHSDECHLLSVGGVCGEVVDKVENFDDPTVLRPLGYISDPKFGRLNLQDFGLRPRVHRGPMPTTILVVGSSMDSGKTTAAFSITHGIQRAGARVCAAKLTGTAAGKDIHLMHDAGAVRVLDFTNAGHASTAGCTREELWNILAALQSHLAKDRPDYIVLEIADGIVQRETVMLLDLMQSQQCIDHVVYTCCDSLGVASGVEQLRSSGFHVTAVSGLVACSPLAADEARPLTDVPVLESQQLCDPAIVKMFESPSEVTAPREAVG